MIVLSNSAVEVIPVGGTVTFNLTVIHTGCDLNGCGGSEYHRQWSGAVRLRGRGNRCSQASIFDLSFNGDMTTMTPDEQLNHLKMDVETMWRDATPEQRKRIKESLTKWSTTLTV